MKSSIRELQTDLKAAVLIGNPESITAAINQIRTTGDKDLPPSALVPLGVALARLDPAYYLPLLGDDDAAVRGAAAAACAVAWAAGKGIEREALSFAADDPVKEVRAALAKALSQSPEKASGLALEWFDDESEHRKLTALQLIANFSEPSKEWIIQLEQLDTAPDHELRAVLVETINALAANGLAEDVIKLVDGWAARPEPNVWVITRTLSAAWTKKHAQQSLNVLRKLAENVGEIRPILRAMEKHDA